MEVALGALLEAELYEAAEVDGANWWQRLWSITVPLVTPAPFFQLVIGVIQALQVFTQPYVMTGGGPYNSTLFLVLYLYQNAFKYFQMGYASALAWILFAYILVLTMIIGPSIESNLRRSLQISGGDPSILVSSPIAVVLLLLALLLLVWSIWRQFRRPAGKPESPAFSSSED